MEYRRLGRSGIEVSAVSFGTMTFGEQTSEADAHRLLDVCLDRGINMIDASETYPVPSTGGTRGLTEKYIGTWLAARGNRDKVIVATKVAGRTQRMDFLGRGETRLNRAQIETAVEGSLRSLQTDYIDLYQLHWPDRAVNIFGRLNFPYGAEEEPVPLEETLAVLGDLVAAGKVRRVGVSNETPWGIMGFLSAAEASGLPRIDSIQNPFNVMNRTFEIGLSEITMREDVGLLAYSPMAMGALSGKYQNGAKPEGTRGALFPGFMGRYANEQAYAAIGKYGALARGHGLDASQMGLAYVLTRPFVTSAIVGATSQGQLEAALGALDVDLTPEILDGIEAIHTRYPNPCP
jgi:aryl-alcohol dehydrogenase-like predicted oxidoreductase